MKLQVSVLEARGLAAADANGLSDPFVRIQLGESKARTSVVYKDLNPTWNEDFVFIVEEEAEELHVVVWDEDRFTDDFLGQVRIPVASVLDADNNILSRVWYPLQKRSEKSKTTVSGMSKSSSVSSSYSSSLSRHQHCTDDECSRLC